jgi:hypothetical protein
LLVAAAIVVDSHDISLVDAAIVVDVVDSDDALPVALTIVTDSDSDDAWLVAVAIVVDIVNFLIAAGFFDAVVDSDNACNYCCRFS